MKHTPGEWEIVKSKSASNVWTIKNNNGEYVGLFSGEVARPALMREAIIKAEANAKLIAAAPEMLSILLDLQKYNSMHKEFNDTFSARLNAAIQKATN